MTNVRSWLKAASYGIHSSTQAGLSPRAYCAPTPRRHNPYRAASIAATSIFPIPIPIPIIAPNARRAAAGSGSLIAAIKARGVICHDTPHRSLHLPHWLACPPLPMIASHSRSVSAWSSVATWNEKASLCGKIGPPFKPMHGMPITVNSTVRTSPSWPIG